ncbi:MAG: aminotransferase class III-fold pyridoxal phosphate-dependent enzyme [Planctomycetes bacterium]|nr:aminotransferase class III-fold pyridoxal phosphate-dependent enzyme [Planctomycetota bacterium]
MLGVKPDKLPDERHAWIGPAPWVETEIPGPLASAMIAQGRQFGTVIDRPTLPVVAKRAIGSVLEDVDGNRFLDFSAGITVGPLGHSHIKVVKAIEDQSRTLMHVGVDSIYNSRVTEFTDRFAAVLSDVARYHVRVSSSAENTYSTAFACARRRTGRRVIVTMGNPVEPCEDVSFENDHVAIEAEDAGGSTEEVQTPPTDLSALMSALDRKGIPPSDIAAIVTEPCQSSGACRFLDSSFLEALCSFCKAQGILFACDETVSGMGRTGRWFAFQHSDATPDIILATRGLAGGMPLAAVLVTDDLLPSLPPASGSYGANPVCCAAAMAVLDVVGTSLLAKVQRLGGQVEARLNQIASQRKVVSDVRGMGLLFALDIANRKSGRPDAKRRDMVLKSCYERGLILIPAGHAGMWFSPPACINEAQLEVGLSLFAEGVATVT